MTQRFSPMTGLSIPVPIPGVYGTPGASLLNSVTLDPYKSNAGMFGELQTAELLAEFQRAFPSMYVFHSLTFPSNSSYDVDHIIAFPSKASGTRVIIIDSKTWPKAQYLFDGASQATSTDGSIKESKLGQNVAYMYEQMLGHVAYIESCIIVHHSEGMFLAPNFGMNILPFSPQQFRQKLTETLQSDYSSDWVIDQRVVLSLYPTLKQVRA